MKTLEERLPQEDEESHKAGDGLVYASADAREGCHPSVNYRLEQIEKKVTHMGSCQTKLADGRAGPTAAETCDQQPVECFGKQEYPFDKASQPIKLAGEATATVNYSRKFTGYPVELSEKERELIIPYFDPNGTHCIERRMAILKHNWWSADDYFTPISRRSLEVRERIEQIIRRCLETSVKAGIKEAVQAWAKRCAADGSSIRPSRSMSVPRRYTPMSLMKKSVTSTLNG